MQLVFQVIMVSVRFRNDSQVLCVFCLFFGPRIYYQKTKVGLFRRHFAITSIFVSMSNCTSTKYEDTIPSPQRVNRQKH